jgi:hypothetical protein
VSAHVWYFAYGSNMQAATFRGRRGVGPLQALAARLPGWRLVLDKPPLVPIGEGFANLVPDPGAEALGVLYRIAAGDWEHVQLTEGVRVDNYRTVTVRVSTLAPPVLEVDAFSLISDRRDPTLRPSGRYMACLIAGAEEHGLPAEYVACLRSVVAGPESAEAVALRPLLDEALRRRG